MKIENLKYSSKHNWIKFKRKIATVGATDYLIDELGDLIDLSLPRVGDEVIADISYGDIESVDVYRICRCIIRPDLTCQR